MGDQLTLHVIVHKGSEGERRRRWWRRRRAIQHFRWRRLQLYLRRRLHLRLLRRGRRRLDRGQSLLVGNLSVIAWRLRRAPGVVGNQPDGTGDRGKKSQYGG